jgi:tripartite-type tricarboxylate transporter receptor subunit TctC
MLKATKRVFAAIGAIGLVAAVAPTVSAAPFYAGKQIKITIGFGFGGTYGKYARIFAEHLGKYIDGNPNLIVQSMPGAGGIKAMNFAANVMRPDGLNLFIPVDSGVLAQLIFAKKVKFDYRDFISLGTANQTNVILVVRADTGITNWKQFRDKQVILGATGRGSTSFLMPNLMNGLLGTKLKIITGYKGSSKTGLSVEQGETNGAAFNWLFWRSKYERWFKGDKPYARPIIQLGHFKDKDLPNVPMFKDQVTGRDRKVVELFGALGLIGRGLAAPKGTDMARVKELRTAFDKMVVDPSFIADTNKRRLRVIPATGQQVQKVINDTLARATPELVAAARKAVLGK